MRCNDGQLGVGVRLFTPFDFETIRYEGDARWVSLTTRVGDAPPQELQFRVDTDDYTAWVDEPEAWLTLLESQPGGTAAIRFTPAHAAAVTSVFELTGVNEVASSARAACGAPSGA